MFARVIVTGLVAFSLLSIPLLYSSGRTQDLQAHIQFARSSKPLRILIEEDFSTAQMLRRELTDWSRRIGIPIIFVEKDAEPYDLRILLASDVGSGSGTCSASCDTSCTFSSSSCSVSVTLHFVSAVALTPDGKLQFTETGVGSLKEAAVIPLARKLAKRLSVLPYAKATPAK